MICPVCRIEMIAVERHGIELDCCISCRGFWFDSGELELLGELTASDPGNLSEATVTRSTSRRKCPRCDRRLDEVAAGTIRLDRCPGSDGIWFDRGELGAIIDRGRRAGTDNLSPVTRFLGEVFGDTAETTAQPGAEEESQP